MSYTGFAGYACHPSQLSSQLSLMTSNSNNSSADSPCCSSSGGTDSRTNAVNTVTNNTNMNLSANEENHITSAMHSSQSLTSSSSVCALTTPYESRIISSYSRLGGLYGPSYAEQNSFYSSSANPFYASFGSPYDMKEPNSNGWAPLPQTTCYPYDPTIYSPYGERYSAMDSATRRKNATRETTNTLKAWLYEHRKNPYPTKGEKIMLAIITKMTLTQVSTWFANARRRLKKENKMTWEPRNKSSDGHDSDDKDSFRDNDENSSNIDNQCLNGNSKLSVKKESDSAVEKSATVLKGLSGQQTEASERDSTNSYTTVKESVAEKSHSERIPNGHDSKPIGSHQINNSRPHLNPTLLHVKQDSAHNMLDGVTAIDAIGHRPKIWSLAQTATSESPPYAGKIGPVTPADWAPALPGGPEGTVALSDYQRDCPQGSRFATNFRKCGQSWTDDHCNTRSAAMHLFASDSIGSHNYFNSHPSKSVTGGSFPGNGHHSHLQLSTPVSHLMTSNTDVFNNTYNGIRPIIDSQSCHTFSDINDNRLTNGTASKSNTFLCKVFPEYISSGPDALSFNDNVSERGGSTLSVEDSSLSSSSSPNLESNTNLRNINTNNLGFSAFRPTLKR